jgi:hypothetical protein
MSAGPNFPTAATGNTGSIGGGTVVWASPTNIELADGSNATCNLPNASVQNQVSDDLIGTGFGFSIPAGATIQGILLEINARQNIATTPAANENSVRLLKAGVAAGLDRSTGADLTTTATTVSYGGAADLWGTTWSPADINNASFGAAASYVNTNSTNSKTVSVDFFRITVTFTANANVNATGVPATGSIGTPALSGTASVSPASVSSIAHIGTAVPTVSPTVVGLSSITHLGTGTFSGTATIAVTGVSSTAAIGAVVPTVGVPVTGVSATGSIGSVTTAGTANINAVGISSTASLGQVRIDAVVSISGVQATAALGQVIDSLFAAVGGVSSTTHLGSVSVEVRSRMPVVVWIN